MIGPVGINCFNEMPVDIKAEIFCKCTVGELARASRVCKDWNSHVNHKIVWQRKAIAIGLDPSQEYIKEIVAIHLLKYTDRSINSIDEMQRIANIFFSMKFENPDEIKALRCKWNKKSVLWAISNSTKSYMSIAQSELEIFFQEQSKRLTLTFPKELNLGDSLKYSGVSCPGFSIYYTQPLLSEKIYPILNQLH